VNPCASTSLAKIGIEPTNTKQAIIKAVTFFIHSLPEKNVFESNVADFSCQYPPNFIQKLPSVYGMKTSNRPSLY
jgi:hypothetical protein